MAEIAQILLYEAAGKLLGELSSMALKKIILLWGSGAKAELEKLKDSVSTIQAVLLDAEQKQATNKEVRDWLGKLEVALYEADDLLDDYFTEVLRHKVMNQNRRAKKVRISFSHSNQLAFRLKMGHKIKKIREKLDAIAADRIKFHFSVWQEETLVENKKREETHSFVRVEDVVGRGEDKNVIVELLLNSNVEENEDMSIIPIVGIGGLGKTALAQLVYNNEKVQKHFELKIWVCVSNVFDVKLIAQNTIESVAGKKSKRIQMDGVKDELEEQIKGKKYFLVLDDMWNEDRNLWLKLRELLIGGAKGSKILLTTRSQLVAKIMGTVSPYLLKGLSESESWSLFEQMAFDSGVEPENPILVAVGKEIIKKCVGVPLVIRTIGALLYIKDTEKEWLYFKDNELSKIVQSESGIFPILKLSYDYLPPNLKQCFAFCSLFPKGHRIDKQTLIQLWVALGFIQMSDGRQDLENVGDQYFIDLLRRSFFQDVEKDYWGNVRSFKMHDLIHDLAQSIVGSESRTIGLDAKDVVARTRHVSVSIFLDSSWEIPTCLLEAKELRTFLLPTQQRKLNEVHMKESTCNKIISCFKRLRLFDLHGLGIEKVSSSIGELKHLRYLDLSNNCFQSLPDCICRLLNLQTLKLNDCKNLKELPKETKNLVSLRHLEIAGCDDLSHMPRGLGQLISLQTLRRFVVGGKDGFNGGLSELEGLVNLKGELSIEKLRGSIPEGNKHPRHYYLDKLEFLEWLILSCDTDKRHGASDIESLFESIRPPRNLKKLSIKGYRGVSFPSWMTVDIRLFLPNVTQISLTNCARCQCLPPFGLLPSLQDLRLYSMNSLEYIYEEGDRGSRSVGDYDSSSSSSSRELFPSLKKLHLYKLERLKGLGSRKRRREAPATATASASASSSSSAAEELLLSSSFGLTPHLTALEDLYIDSCPQLDLSAEYDEENGVQFQSLRSLTDLSIIRMPLVSLSAGLQNLTSLQTLLLKECSKLVVLPESIGNLTSLQHLQIQFCDSLSSLPESMRCLTALQDLAVVECRQLIERCEKETGEDWPMIAHIPSITVKRYYGRC